MNFLAHDLVLPKGAPPRTRVATTLPDLWGFLPKRPLPYLLVRALRADGTIESREVADGIEAHLRADAAFHSHPEFVRRLDFLCDALVPIWPGIEEIEAELAAHVLVEMLLDRKLIAADPHHVGRYVACFTEAHVETVSRLGAPGSEHAPRLAEVLTRFGGSGFLADYATPEGLISRFSRMWSRTRFAALAPVPAEVLAGKIDEWSAALAEGSDVLIEASREAVRGS